MTTRKTRTHWMRDAKDAEVRRRPIAGEYVATAGLPFGRMTEFRSLTLPDFPQEEEAELRGVVRRLVSVLRGERDG